jgi:large subunit ribosomal protein L29
MNLKELRTKSVDDLKKELESLQRAHFALRMQKATQQLQNTSALGKTRRDIARVKTLLNEKARAA